MTVAGEGSNRVDSALPGSTQVDPYYKQSQEQFDTHFYQSHGGDTVDSLTFLCVVITHGGLTFH